MLFRSGVNGSLEVLEMIRTKRMEGTVWNDSKGQADAIIRMAYALAMNEDFPEDIIVEDGKYVYLPYHIITYNNVQQYIDLKTKE